MTPIDQPSLGATNLHHDPAMAQIQLPNLVMTNIAMEAMALIEIDGLPITNGWIFHGYVTNNQRENVGC